MENMNLPEEIDETSNELTHAGIKVALSSLGPIGTAIDELLFGVGDRLRTKRFEKFVKILALKLKEVDDSKIDRTYLSSEEFYDFNIKIFSAALKSRFEEKHKLLSNIFANELNQDRRWREEITDILIRVIDEFSIGHIVVFRFFVEEENLFDEIESYEQLYELFVERTKDEKIELYEFRLYCRDIENKTLLRFSKNINEIGSSGGYVTLADDSEIAVVSVTQIGERFILLLN